MLRKSALVTGAGQRIGADIARRLAAADIRSRCSPTPRWTALGAWRRNRRGGRRGRRLRADLSDPESGAAALREATAAMGPIDLLVNNAAVFDTDSIADLDLALWRRQFAINLEAPCS